MRRLLLTACLIAHVCLAAHPVIFDTDMGNDVDDALALAMLHTLTDRGECELIGVTLTNSNPSAWHYVRVVNRFYGRDGLPVGTALKDLKDGDGDGYMASVLQTMHYAGRGSFEDAPSLLRDLLRN